MVGGPTARPPRSPDLNPLDVYLWGHLLLVPRNFSRGRGVITSLAERGEQSCQRGYYQFGMLRLGVRSGV
jgi:hypothetical protein